MSRTTYHIILSLVFVMIGAYLYLIPTSIQETQNSLIIQAKNDASYSFGSSKWMFFYASNGTSNDTNLNFYFPFWSIPPMLFQKPTLMIYATVNQTGVCMMTMLVTTGASVIVNGLEIMVFKSNQDHVMLLLNLPIS